MTKLKTFVDFCVLLYIPWWLTAQLTANAPQNDFMLIHNINKYSNHSRECSAAALKAMRNHLWYLNEELVGLGFFSSNVENSVKEKMARKLLSIEKKVRDFQQ